MSTTKRKRPPEAENRWRRLRRKNIALFWSLVALFGLFFVLTIVRFEEQHQRKSPETRHNAGQSAIPTNGPSPASPQRPSEMVGPVLKTVLAVLAFPSIAHAEQFQLGTLVIDQPSSRSMPPVAKTGAVYFTIHNTGSEPDRLLSATTAMAEKVEIHTTTTENGISSMRQVDAVTIEPASTVRVEPGGTHMMLVGLKMPLAAGNNFPLTLIFEKAGGIEVHVKVSSRVPASHGPAH